MRTQKLSSKKLLAVISIALVVVSLIIIIATQRKSNIADRSTNTISPTSPLSSLRNDVAQNYAASIDKDYTMVDLGMTFVDDSITQELKKQVDAVISLDVDYKVDSSLLDTTQHAIYCADAKYAPYVIHYDLAGTQEITLAQLQEFITTNIPASFVKVDMSYEFSPHEKQVNQLDSLLIETYYAVTPNKKVIYNLGGSLGADKLLTGKYTSASIAYTSLEPTEWVELETKPTILTSEQLNQRIQQKEYFLFDPSFIGDGFTAPDESFVDQLGLNAQSKIIGKFTTVDYFYSQTTKCALPVLRFEGKITARQDLDLRFWVLAF